MERIFDPEEIVDATLSYARTLCSRSQYSIRASKKIIAAVSRGATVPDDEIQRLRGGTFVADDLNEGMAAVLRKACSQIPMESIVQVFGKLAASIAASFLHQAACLEIERDMERPLGVRRSRVPAFRILGRGIGRHVALG